MERQALNSEQKKAAEAGDGPVVIVAGPGTGKTKTLTARIAHLVTTGRARPEEILALAFTNKAAQEMQARAALLLQAAGHKQQPQVSTFHALCYDILGRELAFAEDAARLQIVRKLQKPVEYKGFSARELGLLISRYKNLAEDNPNLKRLTQTYDQALAGLGLADFDDLLVRARELLGSNHAKKSELGQRYKHILVDEFQDTNLLQYELLKLLLGHDNIFVIGDPNQSIYGFRGAGGNIFEQFKQDFPEHLAIMLATNYRSAPQVVDVGNAVFITGPRLTPNSGLPGQVRCTEVLNEYSEANWVLGEIQRALGGGDFLHAVSDGERGQERLLRDFAIMYRNRSAAMAFQKQLADSGLPYQVVGDGSPYDQPQVQTILALMRACTGCGQPALHGFTASEWQATLQVLQTVPAASPYDLAEKIIETLGFEYGRSLQQFTGTLVRFQGLPAAMEYFDEIAKQDFYDAQADAITLLTIHASKGLEFPWVFLLAAEESILPYSKADLDEEKRLFYVAVTRAKQNLDITHARKRGANPAQPSRFIMELPNAVLPQTTDPNLEADTLRAKKRAIRRSQQSLF